MTLEQDNASHPLPGDLLERLDAGAPGCAAEILGLQLASYREEARLLGIADFPPLHRTVQQIHAAAAEFFAIRRDGRLVGVAEIERHGPRRAHIAGFVVHPELFRRGLGARLLQHVLEGLPGAEVTVSTAAANAPALGLYQRFGFRQYESSIAEEGLRLVMLRRNPDG